MSESPEPSWASTPLFRALLDVIVAVERTNVKLERLVEAMFQEMFDAAADARSSTGSPRDPGSWRAIGGRNATRSDTGEASERP